jgi:hypothetical protein
MLQHVISGCQAGADQMALLAAYESGFQTGGYIGDDYQTEEGPRPDLARKYGLKTIPFRGAEGYRQRTTRNIEEAFATWVFGDPNSAGSKRVRSEIRRLGMKDVYVEIKGPADAEANFPPHLAVAWLLSRPHVTVLNVAGNRASLMPDRGEWIYRYLKEVFTVLKGKIERSSVEDFWL